MSIVNLMNLLHTGQCSGAQFQALIEYNRASSLDLADLAFNHPVNENGISCMDLDPVENKFLITVGQNRKIKIYNTHNEGKKGGNGSRIFESVASYGHRSKHEKHLHRSTVSSVQWYPHDTGMFFTASYDKTICSWDTNRMKPAEKMKVKKQVYCMHMRSTLPNSPLIAAATSSNVNLVDLCSANFTHQLTGHKEKVISVRWSPTNEHLLASGSMDGQVLFWDVRRAGFPMKTLNKDTWIKSKSQGRKRPHGGGFAHSGTTNCIRFTADGSNLLTYGTDNTVRLWSTDSAEVLPVNYGYNSNTFQSQTLGMDVHNGSQDDSLLFVPGSAQVSVYNLHNGTKIKSLRGSIGQTKCCVYNPTTQDLYVTGRGPKILVYSPTTYPNEPTVITSNFVSSEQTDDNQVASSLLQNNWSDSESDGQSDWL